MPAILDLGDQDTVARRHPRGAEDRIGEVPVAGGVAEAIAGERVGPTERQSLLERQRVAPERAARHDAEVHPLLRARAGVSSDVEQQAAELVCPVRRHRPAAADGTSLWA